MLLTLLLWLLGVLLHAQIRPQTGRISRPHPSRPPRQPHKNKSPQPLIPIHGVQEVVSSNLAGPTINQRESPKPQPPPPPV